MFAIANRFIHQENTHGHLQAPLRDMQFVPNELLQVDQPYLHCRGWRNQRDIINQYLESGAQFAENELAPLNQSGDAEGCKLENGG